MFKQKKIFKQKKHRFPQPSSSRFHAARCAARRGRSARASCPAGSAWRGERRDHPEAAWAPAKDFCELFFSCFLQGRAFLIGSFERLFDRILELKSYL